MSTPRRPAPRSMGAPMMAMQLCRIRAMASCGTASADRGSFRGHVPARRSTRRALDAHAEAGVRNGAKLPQVQIPLEGVSRQIVFFDALHQQVIVVNALAAADDFAIAFRARARRLRARVRDDPDRARNRRL